MTRTRLERQFRRPDGAESPARTAQSGHSGLPDILAMRRIGLERCLSEGILPFAECGDIRPVLVNREADAAQLRADLADALGRVALIPCSAAELRARLLAHFRRTLGRQAEERVPADFSCRGNPMAQAAPWLAVVGLAILFLSIAFPGDMLAGLLWLALALTVANTTLVVTGLVASFLRPTAPDLGQVRVARMPRITLFVPLFRETSVLDHLIDRLSALDYPRDRLEILLICEATDQPMRRAIAALALPPIMQLVVVPRGSVQTKPRAMTYALPFASGEIIGIYDAEDAPSPNQLRDVARRFAAEGPRTACLQGALSFYNSRDSWVTRAFFLDYAIWFRVILPALARMDAVVPLGGTTVFLRREALEKVGAWDAHNVTEDADLGVRLRRHGYRCALFDGVTLEEATARPWPWIRQRSRWLKGYWLTWGVHMRNPGQLWRDLGPRGFLWFQMLFLGAVGGFFLAPLLWLCWLGWPLDAPGVFAAWAPQGAWLTVPLAASALMQITAGLRAAALVGRLRSALWIPLLWPYFALGSLAMYKAVIECVTRPYFWDKTAHGQTRRRPTRG